MSKKISAELVVTELKKIEKKYGQLIPEYVVATCRRKSHPLHDWSGWLGWDRDRLSEAMLLQKARNLMAMRLTISDGETQAVVPIGLSVMSARHDKEERRYILYDSPEFPDEIRHQAVHDGYGLKALRRRLNGHVTEKESQMFDALCDELNRSFADAVAEDGQGPEAKAAA